MLHNLQTIQAANSRPVLHLVDPDPDGPASASIQGLAHLKGSIVRLERDAVIVAQGGPVDYCYLIVAGCVRTVGLMQDGRRQIGEFLVPGDLFGWEALGEYGFGAEAVTRATLRRYTCRSLENFARQDRGFATRFRALAASTLRQREGHVFLLGRMTASERIAGFLLQMADRIVGGVGIRIELPMSRADIADYLGLTTETVCRGLTEMQRQGVIAIDRGQIMIRNRGALRARCAASPCSAAALSTLASVPRSPKTHPTGRQPLPEVFAETAKGDP